MKEIRSILASYDAANHKLEKLALAAVVNVEQSSYRRIGARMLVSSNGQWVGGISGGCLEGDALRRSQQAIFSNKVSRVVYDTIEEDEHQIGIGLGCNGRIEVLFLPIDPEDKDNPIEKLRRIEGKKEPGLHLQVIDSESHIDSLGRSIYVSHPNAVSEDFPIRLQSIQETLDVSFRERKNQIAFAETMHGERVKVLVEFMRPETRLIIVGDNYDVNALVGIAEHLGWESHIIGRRKKISQQVFALAKRVYEYEQFSEIVLDDYSPVVLMSHDYNWDKKILPLVLEKGAPYIGLLGPKTRMEKMRDELNLPGLEKVAHFHSPVGLDIGAESPEEIALSIAAEILSVFRNRSGGPLRERRGSIH